jgi:lipopolysaccharide/colanic/teichoic acid biosynthesis glycosyltransferase
MEQNKMKGNMFKLDDDPRVIPIGRFMRRYSIDELPQFFNILKGDMSLVGTRPPTVDEVEQYKMHHMVRLSFRPGLTGLWQINGRSEITDFEQVVKLDEKYITDWSLKEDVKIILKTIVVVLRGKGAV